MPHQKKYFILFYVLLFLVNFYSCKNSSDKDRVPLARVGDKILYKDQINDVLPYNLSEEDSILFLNSYVNTWATRELLLQKALLNLEDMQIRQFDSLIQAYRENLYTTAYKQALVKQTLDTTISDDETKTYYKVNKENFTLNEDLVKLRYINIDKNNTNLNKIKRKFKRFNVDDAQLLDSFSLQYKSYYLNDSVWVKTKQLPQKISVFTPQNIQNYLKKSQFFEINDSLSLYLIHIKDVRKRNEIAPLTYVKPTIKKILLNQRKLTFIKKLEKDIVNDALQRKELQLYQ